MTPRSLRILAQAALVAELDPADRWTKVGPGVFRNELGHHKTEGPHICPGGGYYLCQASDQPPAQEPLEAPEAVSTGSTAENAVESPRERCWRLCSELAREFNFECGMSTSADGLWRIFLTGKEGTQAEKPALGPLEVWIGEAAEITPEQWAALRPAGSTHEQWRGSHRIMGLIEIVSEEIDKITKSPYPEHKRSLRWDHISDMMDKAWHEMTDEYYEDQPVSAHPIAEMRGTYAQVTELAKLLHERGSVNLSGPPHDPVSFSKLIEQFSDQITAALAVKESGHQLSMTVCHICSTPFPTHLGPECPRKGLGCPYGTDATREMARVIAERSRS